MQQRNPFRQLSFDRTVSRMRRRGSSTSLASTNNGTYGGNNVDGFMSDSVASVRAASPGRSGSGDRWKKLFSRSAALSPTRPELLTDAAVTSVASTAAAPTFIPSSTTILPTTTPRLSAATGTRTVPDMTDFLSRESEVLGDDFSSFSSAGATTTNGELDLDRAASAFPDINLDDLDAPVSIPSAPAAMSPPAQNMLDMGSFGDFSPTGLAAQRGREDVKVTGDDEIEKFEDQFPDIDVGGGNETFSSPIPQQPSFGVPPPFAPKPQSSAFASTPILSQPLQDEEEPEVIKAWREKQAEEIKARDAASAARRQETITKAERSIDQFYHEYNAKKERNIKENKEQESEYLATFSDSLSAGTTWSRICEYIDLQNSQSKTLARTGAGTTDLARFKEVFLRLKREGEAAPGAAGY